MEQHSFPHQVSAFLFPLRTNVGFFDSPEGYLTLIERIKQASLLYENLIFEGGVYSSIIWNEGDWDVWHAPEKSNKETLQWMKERFQPTGGQSALFVQAEGGERIPLLIGDVVRRFHCEFHSVLEELNASDLPWITVERFEITEIGKQHTREMAKTLFQEFRTSFSQENHRLLSRIVTNFCKDMLLAKELQAAASIHGLYSTPLVSRVGADKAPGFSALQVAVPNVSRLAWEEIVELREHSAWVEFRKKLLELEIKVRNALFNTAYDELEYIIALSQAFIQELVSEIASYQPKTGEIIGNVAIDLIVGLIPVPGVSAAFTGLRGFGTIEKAESSWVAAFLKTREVQ